MGVLDGIAHQLVDHQLGRFAEVLRQRPGCTGVTHQRSSGCRGAGVHRQVMVPPYLRGPLCQQRTGRDEVLGKRHHFLDSHGGKRRA
jgi:hypothetical protein